VRYFIHYPAWNKKWDEWVEETNILKQTNENKQKQKAIFNEAKDPTTGGKRKSMGEEEGVVVGMKQGVKGLLLYYKVK
jgi:hypothetical protein